MSIGVRHPATTTAVLALVLAVLAVACAARSAPTDTSVAPAGARPEAGGGWVVNSTTSSVAGSSKPARTAASSASNSGGSAAVGARSESARPPQRRARPAVPSSPALHPHANGRLLPDPAADGAVRLNSSDGQTRDGKPYRPKVFTASNLWLSPTGGRTAFDLAIDAGSTIGAATQARVSYDLTGDGRWDRVETYQYFATDPESGLEHYTQDAGLLSSSGSLGELTGGVVRLEVWSALGDGTAVDLAASSLTLPYG